MLLLIIALWGVQFVTSHYLQDFSYELQILQLVGINALMAVCLSLINGITGQFSLGHAGFMAIGAYVSAALTFYVDPLLAQFSWVGPVAWIETTWFLCALFFGGVAAALAGFLIGLPTLRLRGDYLAMATLGFSEIIRVIILNIEAVGAARGFTGIAERANLFWIFFCLIVVTWLLLNLVRSTKGKAFFAIREDEIAAASIGISTTRTKVTAFVIGAFIAGVGGGLFAHSFTYLHTNTFSVMKSIEYVVMVVLGGMGNIFGVLLAAALLTILPELLRVANEYRMILYSLMLIILMIVRSKYKGRRKKE